MDNISSSLEMIDGFHQKYESRIMATTSCGVQSSCLIDLISRTGRNVPIVFIDTGFMFEQTLQYFDTLKHHYPDLTFIALVSEHAPETFMDASGKILDPDRCCRVNKVQILNDFIEERDIRCWFSGMRKAQSFSRAKMQKMRVDSSGVHRVYPIFDWNDAEIMAYMQERDLPRHPLMEAGFESIGCMPCTVSGKGREGRWIESDKTECGLHLDDAQI